MTWSPTQRILTPRTRADGVVYTHVRAHTRVSTLSCDLLPDSDLSRKLYNPTVPCSSMDRTQLSEEDVDKAMTEAYDSVFDAAADEAVNRMSESQVEEFEREAILLIREAGIEERVLTEVAGMSEEAVHGLDHGDLVVTFDHVVNTCPNEQFYAIVQMADDELGGEIAELTQEIFDTVGDGLVMDMDEEVFNNTVQAVNSEVQKAVEKNPEVGEEIVGDMSDEEIENAQNELNELVETLFGQSFEN